MIKTVLICQFLFNSSQIFLLPCVYYFKYPPGFLEAQEAAKLEKEREKIDKVTDKSQKGAKRKKSLITSPITNFFAASPKKLKLQKYELPADVEDLINKDVSNEKLWSLCKEVVNESKKAFLSKVEELFICICCQEIVCKPVSTPCNHNICKVTNTLSLISLSCMCTERILVVKYIKKLIFKKHIYSNKSKEICHPFCYFNTMLK